MGICCCCTSAATLMDLTYHVPNTSPEGLRAFLATADSWLRIVPGAKAAGQNARVINRTESSFGIEYPSGKGKTYTVHIHDVVSSASEAAGDGGKLCYTVSLGSVSDPDATFDVTWTFKAPAKASIEGANVTRLITDLKAFHSLYLPWTLGLASACREENKNIIAIHAAGGSQIGESELAIES